jgi:hypothetical protein
MIFSTLSNRTFKNKTYNKNTPIDKEVVRNHINDTFISKLTGKNPSTDMLVYSSQNPYGGFTRNTNCWLNGVSNISCFSPAQLSGANWFQRSGTLISPRHIISAKHFRINILNGGTPLLFVDDNNNVITRNLIAYELDSTDIAIGLLDKDVPSNIKFAKVLPKNYKTYLTLVDNFLSSSDSPEKLYCVGLDQQEKAIVKRFIGIQSYVNVENIPNAIIYSLHPSDTFAPFTETMIAGDSGDPIFLIIDNELIFLSTWWTDISGPFISTRYDKVNYMMSKLGGGYNLTPIDLEYVYNKYK